MRKLFTVAIALLLVSMFAVTGCDNSTESEDQALTGEWTMNNMQQQSVYLAAEDPGTQQLGFAVGDTVGAGQLIWEQFQALGVSATVELTNEEFTLSGHLPLASDTLGQAPNVIELEDTGTWEANDALTTFSLAGGIYQFNGSLEVDSESNPTVMTVNYSEVETSLDKVVQGQDGNYYDVVVDEHSATTLGFAR